MVVAEREINQAETSSFSVNRPQNIENRSHKLRTAAGVVLLGLGTYFIFDGLNKGNDFKTATGVVMAGIGLYILSRK